MAGPTVLVLIVGIWAIIVGVAETAGEPAGTSALFILAGLIAVAFGVVLCATARSGSRLGADQIRRPVCA